MPSVAGCLLLSFAVSLFAQDPAPPPGGFDVERLEWAVGNARGPITWVDGVRTELDVYRPLHASPASGWPIVLVVHGGESDRRVAFVRERCQRLARMGYVCVAYDVRGDGSTVRLNPPGFPMSHADTLRDMADIVQRLPGLLPAGLLVDPSRVAVTGDSQGGRHAFRASAWSGQALPLPVGGVTHMPAIAAIAPRIAPVSPPDDAVTGNGLFANAHTVTNLWAARGGDPNDPVVQMILAQDWPALHAFMAADPLIQYLPRLRTSTVPMLYGFAWNDRKHAMRPSVDALGGFAAGTTVRTLWSTSGHGTPPNVVEEQFTDDRIRRWFDRWLKGIRNAIEFEPAAEVALLPADHARHAAADSHWPHASMAAWPPVSPQMVSYWLRDGGVLADQPPSAPEPVVSIEHRVAPGYGIAQFCADDRRPSLVLAQIPLAAASFTTAPLLMPLELAGRSRISMEVDSSVGEFYVAAVLSVVASDGTKTLVTSAIAGRRGAAGGRHRLDVEFEDAAMFVPPGARLELSLRNLALLDAPGGRFLRWVPSFVDSDVAVRIDPSTPPRLDLSIVAPSHAFLTPSIARGSISSGISQPMRIEAGGELAAAPFVLLMSASGTWPGLPLPNPRLVGARLPLEFDAWTTLSSQLAGSPAFVGSIGFLDADGQADARFVLPPLPLLATLAGQRFHFAAGGVDAGLRTWASNAVVFDVMP
ncbi:MAG: CocE/NonD family hydrolase [Planctomycetota bacterium]